MKLQRKKCRAITIIICLSILSQLNAKQPDTTFNNHFSFGINTGTLHYNGNVSQDELTSKNTLENPMYSFNSTYHFNRYINTNIELSSSRLSRNGRISPGFENFKTTANSINLGLKLALDSGVVFNEFSKFRPYLDLGIGYFTYEVRTDEYSSSGTQYHYWDDGTIRDKKQNYDNKFTSRIISKDGVYETELQNGTE
ncbi:MAG: outer membrane beta-barrel protein, partial [Flavobacteriales bacterium]